MSKRLHFFRIDTYPLAPKQPFWDPDQEKEKYFADAAESGRDIKVTQRHMLQRRAKRLGVSLPKVSIQED